MKRRLVFCLSTALLLSTTHRAPAPISEPATPTPAPKRTIKQKASENSPSPTKRQAPSPSQSKAIPKQNPFDGTWVGTINGHAGLVQVTCVISGSGTLVHVTSRLGPGNYSGTNYGKTMTWHWSWQNGELVTFTPNSDGKAALMTSEGPAVFLGIGAYKSSATFNKVSP